jgi:DNA-binding CsgD family transcriptional regulator
MSHLANFSRALGETLPLVGSDGFPPRLIALLKELVAVDDATILYYPAAALPELTYFEVQKEGGGTTLDRFLRGAFLLDPYYLAAREGRFGLFRLSELAPAGFRDGEYYRSWYRNCGYQDEAGYLIPVSETGFVNIALGKTRPRAHFGRREMAMLEDLLPTVRALCQQHWERPPRPSPGSDLRERLHAALESFGSSLLTEREAQVINLVLHGHSTKTLAEKLSISMETVKLHRKHAYAKLEVSSQAELFYLFLDSLMSAVDYDGGDTLVSYLQPPLR